MRACFASASHFQLDLSLSRSTRTRVRIMSLPDISEINKLSRSVRADKANMVLNDLKVFDKIVEEAKKGLLAVDVRIPTGIICGGLSLAEVCQAVRDECKDSGYKILSGRRICSNSSTENYIRFDWSQSK
jgi:hypothetical protein